MAKNPLHVSSRNVAMNWCSLTEEAGELLAGWMPAAQAGSWHRAVSTGGQCVPKGLAALSSVPAGTAHRPPCNRLPPVCCS